MNSSDLLRFLKARSSVREYSGEPLDQEDIDYILACASTAPSAGNREAWDVVIVTDDDIRLELASAAFEQVHIRETPAVFVVCANYVRSMSHYGERGILYALEDATIVCTYMMLAAHVRGLHSCWTGAFDEDEVREVLGLPPHLRPVALLAVGKGTPSFEPMERMPVDEHVHRETW
ncbi:nitroreductase [Methanoculleus sp. YWC-01]|jgi:nitroreductase|uniref:Nitroreductase n=1 Tax=Methanoculleus nereidis TaxID=2735141 RepID=A0ABU3Z4W8_9EURY|nr:nitroreductase family protein [Methanoculleus sp. YWC-01]MCK9297627.1 nitroreductase family protein [Methanoculleus sp.]MDV4343867.1 nitroreductase [Methanoculleus sp. YWC-01]PKL55097.1 MAG: nitroreductase [Methanomicrobiales archaeon HGW-Methanomicrobiales-6]